MNIKKTGQLIREKRLEKGMTLEDLSRQIHISVLQLMNWEQSQGIPNAKQLSVLAAALDMSVSNLIGVLQTESSETQDQEKWVSSSDYWAGDVDVLLTEDNDTVVSPLLFGYNIEHTRACISGGLSAQLLRNRKFTGIPSAGCGCAVEWYPIGSQTMFEFVSSYTRHDGSYRKYRLGECNAQRIVKTACDEKAGIGQCGVHIEKDKEYEYSMVVKTVNPIHISVVLSDSKGTSCYGIHTFAVDTPDWKVYECKLYPDTQDKNANIQILMDDTGCISIGAVSLMPSDHFHGMRRDVVDLLKELGPQLLRWPGGNFAGDYNWMDGLMPRDMRGPFQSNQPKTNAYTLGFDNHEINTDDFVALCREVGAEPFITINPCWNTPAESAAWVEYCNGDESTPFGRIRIESGHKEPYNVQFWSLGNEFGHGHMEGDNTPEGYARITAEHGKRMLAVTPTLTLVISGPYPNEQWVERSARSLSDIADLVSQHFYAYSPAYTGEPSDKDEYYRSLSSLEKIRRLFHEGRRQLDNLHPNTIVDQDRLVFVDLAEGLSHRPVKSVGKKMGIAFDEWNVWGAWYRPSNVSDAIYTALTMHMLIEEADNSGIVLACHFQPINEGMISVSPDGASLAAQGQVQCLLKAHIGGKLKFSSRDVLATESENGIITITAINASFEEDKVVRFHGIGKCMTAKLLTSDVILPPSRFSERDGFYTLENDTAVLPPHSVLLLQFMP